MECNTSTRADGFKPGQQKKKKRNKRRKFCDFFCETFREKIVRVGKRWHRDAGSCQFVDFSQVKVHPKIKSGWEDVKMSLKANAESSAANFLRHRTL